nr:MAG TPA_asm: hypothetical protein [Bacteriophage sp.]
MSLKRFLLPKSQTHYLKIQHLSFLNFLYQPCSLELVETPYFYKAGL